MKKTLAVILSIVMLLSFIPVLASACEIGSTVTTANYETPWEDSQFFEYGDYSIHYRVFKAENEKDKIMMIHGFALSGYCWQELATRLVAQGYTCVLVDLPDFGYSTRETAQTDRLPREEIVHALMTNLSDTPWIVAGHSMGGYVALALMQTYPESVSALMLYSTSGYDGMSDGMKKMFTNPVIIRVMGAFMEMAANCDPVFNMALRMGLLDNEYYANYDKQKVTDPIRIKGTGVGAIYSFISVTPTDFDALSDCGKPIFFINGSKDNVISASAKEKLISCLPADAVIETVEGGGHMFIENQADEVSAATLSFLGGL